MGNSCKNIQAYICPSKNKNKKYQQQLTSPHKEAFQITTLTQKKKKDINQDYDFIYPCIGTGITGEVYKIVHKITGMERAVKKISKTRSKHQIQNNQEFQILRCLDHPNIIKIIEIYESSSIYIVTELCTGGELFEKILEQKKFSEKYAAIYMEQILSAISYCHANNVVHRDLKPENILFQTEQSNSLLKIIDFGSSLFANTDQRLRRKVGTIYYIAPEVLRQNYNSKCDIWSCGVILYVLLAGKPPFHGKTDKQIMQKIQSGRYDFQDKVWTNISHQAKNLINKMLELNPSTRISASDALKHDFIKNRKKTSNQNDTGLKETLQNMKNFYKTTKFQQGVIILIANYLISTQQKQKISNQFRQLDLNGDGMISREEFQSAYHKVYNENISQQEIKKIFKRIDLDNSGFINYSEYIASALKSELMITEKKLSEVFQIIDLDKNGSLSKEELKTFLGQGLTSEIYKQISNQINKNQEITKQKFLYIMKNLIVNKSK